jgi:hypothetical protein
LAAKNAFATVRCLQEQAPRRINEEFVLRSGRVGRHRLCNPVNRKRRRCKANGNANEAPSSPSSSPRDEAHDGQKDVTRKWPPDRGHFHFQTGISAKELIQCMALPDAARTLRGKLMAR